MKLVFEKSHFPKSPGGNQYIWAKAETPFSIPDNGKYVIEITASAKNAVQNNSHDDDDLRIAVDGFEFGKYEVHEEKVEWKGFGTASSWDGASLKGGTQIIYFFLELQTGEHVITFYADETPILKNIKVFQLETDGKFEVEAVKPSENIATDKKGIPWMSFVFLGVKPKNFSIASAVRSASQRSTTDGDNLKVVINGKILKNTKFPNSYKYKNFYFSGDANKGVSDVLNIEPEKFEFVEDSVELWYDRFPSVYVNIELFDSIKIWLQKNISEKTKLVFYEFLIKQLVRGFNLLRYKYASRFLQHALTGYSKKLTYENSSSLVGAIKKDKVYPQILSIIRDQIQKGILDGQIFLGNAQQGSEINFENGDLEFSLHGLKKIEYSASAKGHGVYNLRCTLLDVYDFDPKDYEINITWPFIHMADVLEASLLLRDFEIEIRILDTIKL